MNLRNATFLVIVGILYTVLLKLSYLVFSNLFKIVLFIQLTKVISILVILAIFNFIYFFQKEYVEPNDIKFRYITIFSALGPFYIFLIRIKKLPEYFPEFKMYLFNRFLFLYNIFTKPSIEYLYHIFGIIGIILVLLFFIILYWKSKKFQESLLIKPTYYMIIVTGFGFLIKILSLISTIIYNNTNIILIPPDKIQYVAFPVFLITAVFQLYFLWYFQLSIKEEEEIDIRDTF